MPTPTQRIRTARWSPQVVAREALAGPSEARARAPRGEDQRRLVAAMMGVSVVPCSARTAGAHTRATLLALALTGCASVVGVDHLTRTVTLHHDTLFPNLTPPDAIRGRAEKACAMLETGSAEPVLLNAELLAADTVRYTYLCPLPDAPAPDTTPVPALRT